MKRAMYLLSAAMVCSSVSADLTVKATNKLQFARPRQTVEISLNDLNALKAKAPGEIVVKDDSGKELLSQLVDTDYDEMRKPDILIFQSDFGPGETKSFKLSLGHAHHASADDFKAYGRFVRERFDDFAWENDRIAHRTYGKALAYWKGEKLISSSIDIWSKRTTKLVIDRWYMHGNYHADSGEGMDDYGAGNSAGCGGDGLWIDGRNAPAMNFVNSRVLSDGPIRVVFELDYEPFDVEGKSGPEVRETRRRISLDAGSNLDHFQVTYKTDAELATVGIRKMEGDKKEFNKEHGWLSKEEKMEKNGGMQGVAVIVDPKQFSKQADDEKNDYLLVKVGGDKRIDYWAGFYWDKSGQFENYDAWKKYVDEAAQGVASPIEVSVGK